MHTLTWDDDHHPGEGPIHFIHNGDYEGGVIVVLPREKANMMVRNDLADGELAEVTIPFAALRFLVAQYVASEKISWLEQADDKDILGI